MKKILLLSSCLLAISARADFPAPKLDAARDAYHMHHIFSSAALRTQFAGFLDVVLRQIPSADFYNAVDSFLPDRALTDREIYKRLIKHSNQIRPTFGAIKQLQALRYQKAVLSRQARKLIGTGKHIHGCLEIGTPATYINSMKSFLTIEGPLYYLNETERPSDRLQSPNFNIANGFLPYDHFVAMNNYEPIAENAIASNSLDLIVCFIGLHHIPAEKLDAFVASLKRVLRPGGLLLLRDHDAYDDVVMDMVHAAHSVFNAVLSGETIETELAEYRNFQPLAYWITLLEKHGLVAGNMRLQQRRDPSLNTMLTFTKVAVTEEEKLNQISHELQYVDGYKRDQMQTYLTSPEWVNVDVAQAYGRFIEHTPFYEFPYMQSVTAYWKVFKNSFNQAAKKDGTLKVLTSPYTLMNAFIGSTMTLEFAAKAALSAPMRWMYSGEEATTLSVLLNDPMHQISTVDERIKVIKEYPDTSLKLVSMPRYKEFLVVMHKLAHSTVTLVEVAGQKNIQVKIRHRADDQTQPYAAFDGCSVLYDWEIPSQPYRYVALNVAVNKLTAVLKQLEEHGIETIYVHDF